MQAREELPVSILQIDKWVPALNDPDADAEVGGRAASIRWAEHKERKIDHATCGRREAGIVLSQSN